MSNIPQHLHSELAAVEADIRAAFRGVTRDGGTSWSESFVIDNYGTNDEQLAARLEDTEKCWEDLIDDPNWHDEGMSGGFNFLDDVGLLYYLPPAMVRSARRGSGECVEFQLLVRDKRRRRLLQQITPAQRASIIRFIHFMIAVQKDWGMEPYVEGWQEVYVSYWREQDSNR